MFRIFSGAKKGCWIKRWCQVKGQQETILCSDKQQDVGHGSSIPTNDVSSRSFCRYQHNPKEEQEEDRDDRYGDNHHDSWKSEQEWFQRIRCSRHDVCFGHHSFHCLEAVGWGTAVITGLRIARERYEKKRTSERPCGHTGQCWMTRLQHFASSVLHQQYNNFQNDIRLFNFRTTIQNVLPQCTTNVRPSPDLAEEVETKDTQFTHGDHNGGSNLLSCGEPIKFDAFSRPIDVASKSMKFVEPEIKKQFEPIDSSDLDEALHSWQEIAQLYAAVHENAEGMRLAHNGNYAAAVKHWSKAAYSFGYAKAYFNLGICHEKGIGVEQDSEKAKQCYMEAANKGHSMAAYNLAMIYLSSDLDLAMKELQKAADLGLKDAQRELGVLYTETPKRDMKKAASLFQLASSQNDARATYFLGICFENGWGVEKSEARAEELYKQSASAGCIDAMNNMDVFFENDFAEGCVADKNRKSNPANHSTENSASDINIFSRHPLISTEPKSNPNIRLKFSVGENKTNSGSEDFNSDWDSVSDSSQNSTGEKQSPSIIFSIKGQNETGLGRKNPHHSTHFGSVSSEDEGFEAGEPSALEKLHKFGGQFGF